MAGQKARAASSRAKSGGTTTRNGSGSNGSGGTRSVGARSGGARSADARSGGARSADARSGGARSADARSGGAGSGGAGSGSQGQGNRSQANRSQANRGQSNRSQSNRRPDGRRPGGRPGQGRPAGPQRAAAAGLAEDSVVDAADERFRVPAWLQWTSLALSLAGLGVSIYLTIAHYTSTSILDCSSNGLVDCAKVTTSSQSMVFGVFPVAVLGLAFYVFMTAVNSPWGWRLRVPLVWWARIGSAVVGIGFVLYLIYAEIIQIGNICLWCTSVHVITFLLFALLVFAASIGTTSAIATTKPAR
jgi:uncharacterized membrane protein